MAGIRVAMSAMVERLAKGPGSINVRESYLSDKILIGCAGLLVPAGARMFTATLITTDANAFCIFHNLPIHWCPLSLALIGLAFSAAIGVTLLVLGCALPQFSNWWPLFVLFFYILAPIPTFIARRLANSLDTSSSAVAELCIFLTTGIVVSSIGLPVVLAHVGVIQWGAMGLVLAGNVVVFLTILGYFIVFANDDFDYSMW